MITLDDLRRHALARSLRQHEGLATAIDELGFLQADPIRAPARAQDLTLRQRVPGYRSFDLERQYEALEVEEDFFVNYGFVPRRLQALMHPRKPRRAFTASEARRAKLLLGYVREHGVVHPRNVEAHFAHGTVTNYWGGSSNATTHLLDKLHYRGLLRVVRRENGIRLYALREPSPKAGSARERSARLDQLIDVIVATYAPLPALSLSALISRVRYAAPQWQEQLRPALLRAKARLAHALVEGVYWYWPAHEQPEAAAPYDDTVRLLAPFDPLVWDRRRFELFWGWPYRFEAYTPLARRQLGYYALPLLWRGQVLGWGNLSVQAGELTSSFGYVAGREPRDRTFKRELAAELARMRSFLWL